MISKEASEILKKYKEESEEDYYVNRARALDMAIKALEQVEVFDKIRAEIERQEKWLMDVGYNVYTVDIALDAIKAVVAESEDKE